jgi:hypothetical protein
LDKGLATKAIFTDVCGDIVAHSSGGEANSRWIAKWIAIGWVGYSNAISSEIRALGDEFFLRFIHCPAVVTDIPVSNDDRTRHNSAEADRSAATAVELNTSLARLPSSSDLVP